VPPKGAEGEGPKGDLGNFRSETCWHLDRGFPLRPYGPPPPYDGGGK
jgi:hypothetical protein